MKRQIIAIVTLLAFSCTNTTQPHTSTQTEVDIAALQTQVQQLQVRFDSLLQVLQPKPKPATKKAKPKAATQSTALYSTGNASEYNWRPDNTTPTPTVKPKREEAAYGVRTGAICRDGTRSYATGRGACSHHGGVSQWLYE